MRDDDRDLMAGEFALGTLGAAERERLRARAASDPALGAALAVWERRLAPLGEAVLPERPPASLWPRIEAALEADYLATVGDGAADAQIVATLRRRLAGWRLATFASAAAALVFAIMALVPQLWPGEPARYIAVLSGGEGRAGFVVTAEMDPPRLVVRSLGMTAPPAKSYELWVMPSNEHGPATLGLVARREIEKLEMPRNLEAGALHEGVKLAVSLEPEGGAPGGHSMGPIVFAGELIRQTN